MSRKRIVLVVLVVGLIAVAAVAASVWPRHTTTLTPPSPEAERQMRAAIISYRVLQEPVRPAKFYGKQLTSIRCVSLMKGVDTELREVADGEALQAAKPGWMTLAGLIRQEQDLSRDFREGTIPVSWEGEIGYWELQRGGGDTYTVRAAVLETLTYGRWDAKARKLADLGTMAYDDASAYELTLRRIDGAWKVIDVRHWMSFNRESGVHSDSA